MVVADSYVMHAVGDPDYYDHPGRCGDRAQWFGVARGLPPVGWVRADAGLWVMLRPMGVVLPDQGWKIHVSARAGRAEQVVDVVWRFCVARGLAFKFLRSGFAALLVNSKGFPRVSSGKLITIYPSTVEVLRDVLDPLADAVRCFDGPYILGDLRWGDAPIFIRYGGFIERHCLDGDGAEVLAIADPTGRLVPDRRGVLFEPPDWLPLPGFLAEKNVESVRDVFPYWVETAVQFSNAGGVYLARDSNNEQVILKEARPHAGVDGTGRDALSRLRTEFAVLTELADLDFVPAVRGLVRWWEHEFLVLEKVDGMTLTEWMAHANPGRQHPQRVADYTVTALRVLDDVEHMIVALHGRGWIFGDLQPCNVIRRPDGGLTLVDFESAFRVGQRRSGLSTPGFSAPADVDGIAVDHYSLACLRLHMFLPLTPLLASAPDKAAELVRAAMRRFPLPGSFARSVLAGVGSPSSPHDTQRISVETRAVRAILASATPNRDDRLYPGDPRQFQLGALGLAYGAAGVFYAVSATGFRVPSDHIDWLIARIHATPKPRLGLYDGLHGVAWLLLHLNHRDLAARVLDRALDTRERRVSASLFDGDAGIVLNLLYFADHFADRSLVDHAATVADRWTAGHDTGRRGLMFGRSGLAVALTALHEATGDQAWREIAVPMIEDELAHVHTAAGRADPTLATGAAGVALAVRRVLGHQPLPELRTALAPLLSPRILPRAGLLAGQAGLLLGAAANADLLGPAAVAEHRDALLLHGLPHRGGTAFLGEQQLRISMDLATGTAGALLALAAAQTGLGLPLLAKPEESTVHPRTVAGERKRW